MLENWRTTLLSKHWPGRAVITAALSMVAGLSVPLAASVTAYAAATPVSATARVQALLAPLIANGSFSGSVLVAQRGRILVDQGYGMANRFQNVPDTSTTRYAIGSLTQGFLAVAAMQFVVAGKLQLDAPVSTYVQSQNSAAKTITVRELLTQTSGAPGTPTAPSTQPGTHFTYSPLNYELLGQIIAAVAGESCESYIQQHILTPLGLTNTGFITTDTSAVQGAATGYDASNSTVTAVNYSPGHFTDALGMYSTTEDLFTWDQALYTGRLIPLSAVKQIFTVSPIALASMGNIGYGFGWTLTPDNAVAVEESLDNGFQSFIDRDLQNDTTVIILSNDDYSPMQQIAGQLESIVTNTPLPPVVQPQDKVGSLKHIVVNTHPLLSVDSRIANNTTYMPLFYTGKAFGAVQVNQFWNGARHVLRLTTNRPMTGPLDTVQLGHGNTDVYLNGQLVMRVNTYAWPDPATAKHNITTYAPIYYIMLILKGLGVQTSWNGVTWSIQG